MLDLQGSGHSSFDPEIACCKVTDGENDSLFHAENLTIVAIHTFSNQHKCNVYCNLLGLAANPVPTLCNSDCRNL